MKKYTAKTDNVWGEEFKEKSGKYTLIEVDVYIYLIIYRKVKKMIQRIMKSKKKKKRKKKMKKKNVNYHFKFNHL